MAAAGISKVQAHGRMPFHLQEDTEAPVLLAGATQAERLSPAAVAATEHMSREEAHAALGGGQALGAPVRDAVFTYWWRKRAARGRPLLRRLQAPTSSSDTNPFNVFRRAPRMAFRD